MRTSKVDVLPAHTSTEGDVTGWRAEFCWICMRGLSNPRFQAVILAYKLWKQLKYCTYEPYKKMHPNKTLRTIPKVRWSIVEGSLEVKLPRVWRDEKQSRQVESEEGRYRCAKIRRKNIQSCKMLYRKVANRCVFQWFVGREGRKVGWLKRRVRSHVARGEMKIAAPSTFSSQNVTTFATVFGGTDVEKRSYIHRHRYIAS